MNYFDIRIVLLFTLICSMKVVKTAISKSKSGILCRDRINKLRYQSMIHLLLWFLLWTFFIDKIDSIGAEFSLLEVNLPSY